MVLCGDICEASCIPKHRVNCCKIRLLASEFRLAVNGNLHDSNWHRRSLNVCGRNKRLVIHSRLLGAIANTRLGDKVSVLTHQDRRQRDQKRQRAAQMAHMKHSSSELHLQTHCIIITSTAISRQCQLASVCLFIYIYKYKYI